MKTLAALIAAVLLLAAPAFAKDRRLAQPVTSQTINSTGTYTSDPVDVSGYAFFGAHYKCTSVAGTPTIKIEILQAPVAAADYVSAVTVESAMTAETAMVKQLSIPPMPLLKVKITGNSGNQTDTVCNLHIWMQE